MDHTKPRNRRLDRRIPIALPARLELDGGLEEEAMCVEMGVGGLTLHARYVPRPDEEFTVTVSTPDSTHAPLRVRLAVKRCQMLEVQGVYEIGGKIVKTLT
ncbi:MAG: PilZ domain-containing protein [Rhodocyclaceae bacterium]|nr:PilZ domain-containing protein [Rhodocyclaceae bacterium]